MLIVSEVKEFEVSLIELLSLFVFCKRGFEVMDVYALCLGK